MIIIWFYAFFLFGYTSQNQVEQCGIFPKDRYLETRIVGGEAANDGDVPWIASIQVDDSHRCGGSLISLGYVLTAAHCLTRYDPEDVTIVLGTRKLIDKEASRQEYRAETFIIHESYRRSVDRQFSRNDIALIKLKNTASSNERVWPICLPSTSAVTFQRGTVATAGFGTTQFGGRSSDILMKVNLAVHSNMECTNIFPNGNISANHLCAGQLKGGQDACQGDSGGPLYRLETTEDRWTLIGVVSEGEKCALKGKLGIYTRVSQYLDWIEEKMKASDDVTDVLTEKPVPNFLSVLFTQSATNRLTTTASVPTSSAPLVLPNFIQTLGTGGSAGNKKMSSCIQCICEASSGCTTESPTQRRQGLFGMFTMEKGYWLDGGKLRIPDNTLPEDEAFEQCAANEECAVKTVEAYLTRYKKDCNGDSAIDCDDFARLHRKGPGGCSTETEKAYWERYTKCKSRGAGSDFTKF